MDFTAMTKKIKERPESLASESGLPEGDEIYFPHIETGHTTLPPP